MLDQPMVSVIIPSYGRPKILEDTVSSLLKQTVSPLEILISVVSSDDITPTTASIPSVRILYGHRGSCAQRNTGIRALDPRSAFVLFLDDDVELPTTYIEAALRAMSEREDAAVVAGTFLAERVTRERAREIASKFKITSNGTALVESRSAFGGNMLVRAFIAKKIPFDESLPLYGWLEDFDWSAQAARLGKIIKSSSVAMVHLAAGTARISPKQYGYVQIVNPCYLWKKRSIRHVGELIYGHWGRTVPRNIVGCVIGANRAERMERLRGNALAFRDLFRGRCTPMRATEL